MSVAQYGAQYSGRSPRMRGKLFSIAARVSLIGSIPAHAG